MNRAFVNFIVDTAIAAAFVVSAVSGLVFLLPAEWLTFPATSSANALGVEYATWRTLHDWTAVIMIAGVVLHTALHWRWVTMMVRRLAGDGRAGARSTATVVPRPAATRAVASTAVASQVSVRAADVPAREQSGGASRESAEQPGLTRNAFLKRVGAVGAAALVGGLVGRSAASAAVSWLDGSVTTGGGSSTASLVEDSTAGLGSSSGGSGTLGAGESAQTTTSTARVVIDSGRCTRCGACIQVCPYGVFSADGGAVVVADSAACRLCGRCVQACPAAAITLNG